MPCLRYSLVAENSTGAWVGPHLLVNCAVQTSVSNASRPGDFGSCQRLYPASMSNGYIFFIICVLGELVAFRYDYASPVVILLAQRCPLVELPLPERSPWCCRRPTGFSSYRTCDAFAVILAPFQRSERCGGFFYFEFTIYRRRRLGGRPSSILLLAKQGATFG
uniref:Uncharacterized protein n=1 Tax=Trichuris muris TaxID=70415 RepID=A0A5S6Q8T9_TRIMR